MALNSIAIPADRARDMRAAALAKHVGSWPRHTLNRPYGQFEAGTVFRQAPGSNGEQYLVNAVACQCVDYKDRGNICKHIRAICMFEERAIRCANTQQDESYQKTSSGTSGAKSTSSTGTGVGSGLDRERLMATASSTSTAVQSTRIDSPTGSREVSSQTDCSFFTAATILPASDQITCSSEISRPTCSTQWARDGDQQLLLDRQTDHCAGSKLAEQNSLQSASERSVTATHSETSRRTNLPPSTESANQPSASSFSESFGDPSTDRAYVMWEAGQAAGGIRTLRPRFADLYPACPCGDLSDGGPDNLCFNCASDKEFAQQRERRSELAAGGRR